MTAVPTSTYQPLPDAPLAPHRAWQRCARWVRTHPGLVVVLVVPFVIFTVPLFWDRVYLDGDNFLQNFPLRALVGRDLRHGVLPLLNPYLFSGTPLLGGFNAAAAYPTTWLMAVLPQLTAWTVNLAVTYDVAVIGTYLFLRRQPLSSTAATFGAATFAFAGCMSAQIVHIDLIEGAAWLPWILLAIHQLTRPPTTDRRSGRVERTARRRARWWVGVLAVALGLSFLSGGAEAIIDSVVLVAIYAVWQWVALRHARPPGSKAVGRSVVRVGLGAVGGLALGAAQWLPGLAFAEQSQRASSSSYQFFSSGSLPLRMTVLIASPFIVGTNQNQPAYYTGPYNFPEVTSYVGILALIAGCALCLRRWRRRPEARLWRVWYLIMAVGVLCALGGQTPFGHLLFLIPGIQSERLLNRNLLLVDFALAVLLAWWIHLLLLGRGERPATPDVPIRRRWQPGRRAELVLTCAPAALIVLLCAFLWIDGPLLDRALGTQVTITAGSLRGLAVLVTGGAVIAVAATWIVLVERRFSTRTLRRLLTAVLAVDLVLFNAYLLHPPTTRELAMAEGPMATTFTSLVGNGRFVIYDPDQFYDGQLYALGQTDLNAFNDLPSAQGYTALTAGDYYGSTGAHYQEDLDVSTLAGPTWDQLNVRTLLSLPGYFVTPVPAAPSGAPAVPLRSTLFPRKLDSAVAGAFNGAPLPTDRPTGLAAGQAHRWYFGGVLTLEDWGFGLARGSASALRVGLVTTDGGIRWLPVQDMAVTGSDGTRSVHVSLPSPVRVGGVVVQAGPGPRVVVDVPTARTVEAGQVAFNGRMQYGVNAPHWAFTGTLGSFGVFENTRARGWAWTRAPGGGPAPSGTSVVAATPGLGGEQQIVVDAAGPALLERSVSYSPGWLVTIQPLALGPTRVSSGVSGTVTHPLATGPARAAGVVQSGIIQQVALPAAGEYLVSFRYAPSSAFVGLVSSAMVGAGLVGWAVVEAVGSVRRRRRSGEGPGCAVPLTPA